MIVELQDSHLCIKYDRELLNETVMEQCECSRLELPNNWQEIVAEIVRKMEAKRGRA